MRELDYFVVDVFTEQVLGGNPLAVVMDDAGLSDAEMLAVTREFNLSETTFVRLPIEDPAHVRIFTTAGELPFAGHPTLGSAAVLRRLHGGDVVTLALKAGSVPVRFTGSYGEMTQPEPELGAELDRAKVAELCGLREEDLSAELLPQVSSTGTAFAIVPLTGLEALARLKVDQAAASLWLKEKNARWFYAIAPVGDGSWRARLQFHGGEDPATGSAAGCAIAYLVARGAVQPDEKLHLKQGVEAHRPSDLFLAAGLDRGKPTNVRVGGSTAFCATGRLFLP